MGEKENIEVEPPLYTLIPLEDFKAVLGIDDRDDKLAKFCLVTAAFTIEQYCKRRFLRKKYFERIEYIGDLILPLREYHVSEVLAVFLLDKNKILELDLYCVIPDCGFDNDIPFIISFSPAVARLNFFAIKVVYYSGYDKDAVPKDFQAACLELASWNMSRYKGRRIGMTGNIKGVGIQGEHFEMSMPENVKALLEPYKRRLI